MPRVTQANEVFRMIGYSNIDLTAQTHRWYYSFIRAIKGMSIASAVVWPT
jgi:hypothetical protein